MIRYIPGKTRVKTEFMKNITFGDIILAVICLVFAIVIIASSGLFVFGGFDYKWYALIGWIGISIVLFLPIDDGLRLYSSIILIIRFTAFPKKYIKSSSKSGKKTRCLYGQADSIHKY